MKDHYKQFEWTSITISFDASLVLEIVDCNNITQLM